PEVEDLLDDLALLIHLDRIHAAVATLVLVLRDGAVKRRMDVAETMLEDVGEPDKHGKADPAHLQPIDELLQVDGARLVLGWMDLKMPLAVNGKVAVAPPGDFVELAGIVDGPCGGRRGARSQRGRRRAAVRHRAHLAGCPSDIS